MRFTTHSFRHSLAITNERDLLRQREELFDILGSISEPDIMAKHQAFGAKDKEKLPKSISKAINQLLKERLCDHGWTAEPKIFQDQNYQGDTWRLDFAKGDFSVEVAFNHASVIAWNLLKPVLASELNHVKKAIQTKIGVVIAVTQAMKEAGGFDSAIGTFEKFQDFLPPLGTLLTVPIILIGLKPPETFRIQQVQYQPRKKIGEIIRLPA